MRRLCQQPSDDFFLLLVWGLLTFICFLLNGDILYREQDLWDQWVFKMKDYRKKEKWKEEPNEMENMERGVWRELKHKIKYNKEKTKQKVGTGVKCLRC